MLPIDAGANANFLSPEAADAADQLLSRPNGSGIVEADRLRRNLLASQPACVNLFGAFVGTPGGLTRWVRSIDPDCAEVTEVLLEHAPPRDEHFGGGSAFDAFIDYATPTGRRFLGIETKYSENLRASNISVRDVYREFTVASSDWLDGAERRLDVPMLRQFWLTHC